MSQYAIVATLTLSVASGSHVIDLENLGVPDGLDRVIAGAEKLGIRPEIKASASDESGELVGTLSIGSGSFWLPIPEVKLPIPGEAGILFRLAEGITGAKPGAVLDVQLTSVAS